MGILCYCNRSINSGDLPTGGLLPSLFRLKYFLMFTANIMEKISGALKLQLTLRLRQWILDQMRTDHQMHTGWHLANKQWGMNRTNGIYSFPIPFTEALCCFGGGGAGSGYYDNASAYSNTQVYVYSDGSSRFVSWIAIGG